MQLHATVIRCDWFWKLNLVVGSNKSILVVKTFNICYEEINLLALSRDGEQIASTFEMFEGLSRLNFLMVIGILMSLRDIDYKT